MTPELEPLYPDGFPIYIDNSMRTAFASCERKFFHAYMERIVPKEDSIHLHFGRCFAAGCERFRRSYYTLKVGYKDALDHGVLEVINQWESFEEPEGSKKTLTSCVGALESYFAEYDPRTDHMKPLEVNGQHLIEYSFAHPLEINHPTTKEPILYCGKLDFGGEFNSYKWAVDEKTTSSLSTPWVEQWQLNSQLPGYVWAGREHGVPLNGAVIRGTAILKDSFKHLEVPILIPEWKITQWHTQLLYDIERMIECWERDRWGQNLSTACGEYFTPCAYKKLCNNANPENWKSTYYKENTWSPVKGFTEQDGSSGIDLSATPILELVKTGIIGQ